jgi:hypothetical protein
VEKWIENINDRRRILEIEWKNSKKKMEKCMEIELMESDLKGMEEVLVVGKEDIER